ncbi:AAA family ATPase [Cellulomonas sp. URHD0024]|uniref:AAA family ATPase n=1 Tax=Cellulomonas sp. URHD0024 TaxID=1302620 RepID=UPI00041979D1|nr:AAA family ATPase [Cellulomonas sp. URHD0024]
MPRILVTGMSGAGKTTLLDALDQRGRLTVDTDRDGWVLADGRWDEQRMAALLDENPDIIVAGTVENQGRFYPLFDHVVLLSAPVDVLLERVTARTNNPYGSTVADRTEIRHTRRPSNRSSGAEPRSSSTAGNPSRPSPTA